jgi:hypothetical protein
MTQADVCGIDVLKVAVVLKELKDFEQRRNGAREVDGRKVEHDCLTRKKRAIVPGRVDARQGEAPDGAKKKETEKGIKRRRACAR